MTIENFTGKAEAYVIGRPGYPKAAIEKIIELAPVGATFADIGAGTGKFTEKLAEFGHSIFAVEPNNDMRSQLSITLDPFANVMVISGTAEATTLANHSVDVLTVAHAMHWFNLDTFRVECRRIVKPGGLLIAIYNHIPGRQLTDSYKEVVDEFFTNPMTNEFSNSMEYTREKWLAYFASQDDHPLPMETGYEAHIAEVNALFDRDSVNDLLHIDRLTIVYSERLE